ncbi:hypothetical protein STEG23_016768, partial [Scotinomys teguina]
DIRYATPVKGSLILKRYMTQRLGTTVIGESMLKEQRNSAVQSAEALAKLGNVSFLPAPCSSNAIWRVKCGINEDFTKLHILQHH